MLTPFPVCQFRSSRPSCDLVRLVNIFSMSSHAQPQAGGSWGPSVSTVAPPLGLASTFSFPLAQPSAGGPWGGSVTTCAPSFGLAAPSLASAQPLAGGPFFGLTQTSAQPLAGGSSGLTFPVHAQSMAGGLWGGPASTCAPSLSLAPSFASAQLSAGGPPHGLTLTSAQPSAGGPSGLTFPAHAQSMSGGLWGGPVTTCAPSLSLAPSFASIQLSAGGPPRGPMLASAQPMAGGPSGLTIPGLTQPPVGGAWGGSGFLSSTSYGPSPPSVALAQPMAGGSRPGLVWSLSQAQSSVGQPGLGSASSCAAPFFQAPALSTAPAPHHSGPGLSGAPLGSHTLGLSLPPQHLAVGSLPSPVPASGPSSTSRPSTPFRPWDGQARYEPISPPCPPLEGERELNGKSLPSILRWLQTVDGKLVTTRPHRTHIQSEAESMAQGHQPLEGELLASQSSLLGELFLAVGLEVSGQKTTADEDHTFRAPTPKPLRPGQFLPSSRKLRPFKSAPLLGPGPLPSGPLGLAEGDKAILASHEGRSNAALTCTLPDKALSDWEETLRLALESSSFSDTLINVLFKDAKGKLDSPVSVEQREALLLASSTAIRATMECVVRAYHNIILARRDGVLAKAKSRLPAADKEGLRVLPISPPSLFGPEVAKTPSLQPPSEATLAVREMAKALTPRKPLPGGSSGQQQNSPGKKRFGSSPKGKGPLKSARFAPYRKGAQGPKGQKPSPKAPAKGKHPQ